MSKHASKRSEAGRDCADLLVELGCEELPPKTLKRLAHSFFDSVCKGLTDAGIELDPEKGKVFYTPRRLGFKLSCVAGKQADRVLERKGPAVSAAFDEDGNPTQAALGFARSVGKNPQDLDRQKTDKGEWLFCRVEQAGDPLGTVLYPILEKALATLPVAKPMRWSDHEYRFVRPVHWLIVLHGKDILDGSLFGISAGRETRGHRIHNPGPHPVQHVDDYESVLEKAFVMVDPGARKQKIKHLAIEAGQEKGGKTRITESLLDEVTNIIEWPCVVTCEFEEIFLEVPQEALIASMEDQQKFFPVLNTDTGKLTSGFVVITNIDSKEISAVKTGFERVIRPRLADSRFFWEQDQKIALEGYSAALNAVVFQKELGSVGDKSRRIAAITCYLADFNGYNTVTAERASLLCKCDLLTQMVGEFPALQGTMGRYYALKSGESAETAQAIGEHYSPRFSGDQIPDSKLGCYLSIADRIDTIVGIFAVGLKPTGNKDPFALRRAALGIVRILTEAEIPVSLHQLLATSIDALSGQIEVSDECRTDCLVFLLDRLRHYFLERGANTNVLNAVFAAPVSTLPDLQARLNALSDFMSLPEADNLVAANKRIGNILKKSNSSFSKEINENLLIIEEERDLLSEVNAMEDKLSPLFEKADYTAALKTLASLDQVITAFFDNVMVMDQDIQLRNNRLALLFRLKSLFDRVADLAMAT